MTTQKAIFPLLIAIPLSLAACTSESDELGDVEDYGGERIVAEEDKIALPQVDEDEMFRTQEQNPDDGD